MQIRIIIAGGGTGGHIFPAVAIANEIRRRQPQAELLFVGANGGMEMDLVPRQGYTILPVWISGIQRQITFRNLMRNLVFPLKLVVSLIQASRILGRFRPQMVVGVGGFASAPVGRMAATYRTPLVICEQNAYPGLVNRWLAPRAKAILLGNPDAQKYFPAEKSQVTGNPIRRLELSDKKEAKKALGFDPEKPLILSLGGSLGARTINRALLAHYQEILDRDVQLFWQCGKIYFDDLRNEISDKPGFQLRAFIDDMARAYSAADLVISRAGGSTISELVQLEKPAILVPSPNVAEDHQTKNAASLADKDAAILIADGEAQERLVTEALKTLNSSEAMEKLQRGLANIEKHQADKEIVDAIFKIIGVK